MRRMSTQSCDLLIVGAGINGAGIARDAALRGLQVVVCDRGDVAGATSSASTKLIHGGVRYLEQAAFGLVRESLREREILGRIAAHLVRPQRFIVPHTGERPAWMLALGLALYDLLAGTTSLPAAQKLRPDFPLLRLLDPPVRGAHAYHDLWVDDARLTLTNLIDAREHGAEVLTRRALVAVSRHTAGGWTCTLAGEGGEQQIRARCVVNVAGPWMRDVELLRGGRPPPPMRLVQGTHIVVPRLHDGDDAWLLQQPDKRDVFVIPYGACFHLVGTTETELDSPAQLGATVGERSYLLGALQRAFGRRMHTEDIHWEFSGMRPLIGGEGSARTASREYRLTLDADSPQRGWMAVQGGKLTTYRRLAERAVDQLAGFFKLSITSSTADRVLPGAGDAGSDSMAALARGHAALPAHWIAALWRRHGTRTGAVIAHANDAGGPGIDFGGGLYEAEARWCIEHEWAREAEDVLWRRTKCGLVMTPAQRAAFADWWTAQRGG
jgi:glycerol-3-phosphate dehydrogenase